MSKACFPNGIFLKNITFSYGKTPLFDQLDVAFKPGRCSCLLGKSGVGKTTLLRLIAGLLPSHLMVNCTLDDSDHLRALQKNAAYMGQTDLLQPWRTVLDNVLIGALLRGAVTRSDTVRAKHLLDCVGLSSAQLFYPAQLSGGMKQRVALARTLFENKPLILMDEPFSSLDLATKLNIEKLTAELLSERTILMVTHDPLEALRFGHDIYCIEGAPAALEKVVSLPFLPWPRSLDQVGHEAMYWQLVKRVAA